MTERTVLSWRTFGEDETGVVIEVDLSPTERGYLTVPESQFGTSQMEASIRLMVERYDRDRRDAETPG